MNESHSSEPNKRQATSLILDDLRHWPPPPRESVSPQVNDRIWSCGQPRSSVSRHQGRSPRESCERLTCEMARRVLRAEC